MVDYQSDLCLYRKKTDIKKTLKRLWPDMGLTWVALAVICLRLSTVVASVEVVNIWVLDTDSFISRVTHAPFITSLLVGYDHSVLEMEISHSILSDWLDSWHFNDLLVWQIIYCILFQFIFNYKLTCQKTMKVKELVQPTSIKQISLICFQHTSSGHHASELHKQGLASHAYSSRPARNQ